MTTQVNRAITCIVSFIISLKPNKTNTALIPSVRYNNVMKTTDLLVVLDVVEFLQNDPRYYNHWLSILCTETVHGIITTTGCPYSA